MSPLMQNTLELINHDQRPVDYLRLTHGQSNPFVRGTVATLLSLQKSSKLTDTNV